ncbi:MAG: hypothetical protein P4M11_15035 [Candidatus Pacebacteria bacterium]|nr:hypothetical protein [Candidatus Paceibacterota bacterium]
MSKTFYIIIFTILMLRQTLCMFLSIFSGIMVASYPAAPAPHRAYVVQVYLVSAYVVEGLFIAGIVLLFWSLRLACRAGYASGTSQILLLGQRILSCITFRIGVKTETNRYSRRDLLLIIVIVIIFYSAFLLRAGDVLSDIVASTFFFAANTTTCTLILLLTLYYAIRYAGNPVSSCQYKRIINKTRSLLMILAFTRIVNYLAKRRSSTVR